MRILLIEDEPLIQKSLKRLLEARGASVSVMSSGKEAIKLILAENFDRIICDLMLRDITGFDVLEESKQKYRLEELSQKFVIITAYSSDQVLKQAAKYNCPILSKPFRDIPAALDIFLNVYVKENHGFFT